MVLSSGEVVVLSSTSGKYKKIRQKIIFQGKIKVNSRFQDGLGKFDMLKENKNLEKIVVKSLPECETKFFHLVSKALTSTTTSEHDSTNGPLGVYVCLSRKSKF